MTTPVARRQGQFALAAAVLLAGLGVWQLGGAALIHGKAWLAQVLLERAWQASLAEGGRAVRPWPWADSYPVARLLVPSRGVDLIVLAGASGRSLAFAPGHLDGTAQPGTAGHSIVSGHRDTHFRFLQDLAPGEAITVQRPDGGFLHYSVRESQVIDSRHARLNAGDGHAALTLVTCYPFDAIVPGGPLRYLVFAEESSPATAGLGPKRVVRTMPARISTTPAR